MMDWKIKRCFEGTKEIPPRLIKAKPSISTAEEHLIKADKNLLAMDLMHENKFFDWTIVCAYYAMYHATMASLWLLGLDARSHECALLAFRTFYIKKGRVAREYYEYLEKAEKLSAKYGDTLEKARFMRINASYGLGEAKSWEAEAASAKAKDFVNEIKRLVYEEKGVDLL